jgi:hypothetical protein
MNDSIENFVLKIKNFNVMKNSQRIEYFVYYLSKYSGLESIKAKNIENCFNELSIPPFSNISRYLNDNAKKKKGFEQKFIKKSDNSFKLTRNYEDEIKLNIVEDNLVKDLSILLRDLLSKVTNNEENNFLEEAIKSFEIGAYRSAIIMTWILTIDHLYTYILSYKKQEFINSLKKINSKISIYCKDDFSEIKESQFIEICRNAQIISNDTRKILDYKLGIRNTFAHPSTTVLTKNKALEFIEDLIVNVILKYNLTNHQTHEPTNTR